jgi:hypothetical protein
LSGSYNFAARQALLGDNSPFIFLRGISRPILKPCPKFHRANIYQFAEHLKQGEVRTVLGSFPPVKQGIGHDEISKRQQELKRTSLFP